MIFSNPQWNPSTNSYTVKIISPQDFSYVEVRDKSSGSDDFNKEVDISNNDFQYVVSNLATAIYEKGSSWFASPIKPHNFIKKAKHTIDTPAHITVPGNKNEFTWNPVSFEITPRNFEIRWKIVSSNPVSVIPSNFIDISEEVQPRTIVIQQNDIIENAEIPFDNSEQNIQAISSRAIHKQKVRKAKLKASIATMKAERMAEKYFRRYGIQIDLGSDSELSFGSDGEDSEEE
jgi:hypothetical protein